MKKNILMYYDLMTSIKTVNEANSLSSEIDTLTATLFKSENMSLSNALASINMSDAKKITEMFSKNNLDINDKETVSDILQSIKNLIKKFKIIKLILAFDPSLKTIEKIHNYVSLNIGIGYILDIELSESVLGGSVVIFNGKYNDFTLKKTLEEVFANKRKEIINQN
ncbi:MAG: hypothetical protein Q8P26_05360 [Candidatus Levybacteria bacterium]|nr:hypothetical protein [Candidatus Levybacteria bacterium]